MSDFEVLVYRIKEPVVSHPDADRLSLVQIEGYTCISAKLEDGSHRYAEGDLVVYIPEQAVLPECMMKDMDFWDINKDKPSFRYVKAKKLRGIFSQGILHPIVKGSVSGDYGGIKEGDNVAEKLGITKYEPVVPSSMSGQMTGAYMEYTMKYDFDSIQKQQDMFDETDEVVVTEKLHGTLIQIIYVPGLNDPNAFGEGNNILVTSKGMGAKGFVYKNVPENKDNLYVRVLNNHLGCLAKIFNDVAPDRQVTLFGEITGLGVQDLTYGDKWPVMRLFDVAVNKEFVSWPVLMAWAHCLSIELVPELYRGPFDRNEILTLRDGQDTIRSIHVREGVVIKSFLEANHPRHGRKIAKWISPDYLLRKNGTEYN